MAPKYRLCPRCRYRYERIKQKCPNCSASRPKKRVPKHAETLRDDTYEDYLEVARLVHGVTDESCCVCRKPRAKERRHDREHGHKRGDPAYGKPRGIACSKCNMLMKFTELDMHRAKLIYEYLARVHNYYITSTNTKPEGPDAEGPGKG